VNSRHDDIITRVTSVAPRTGRIIMVSMFLKKKKIYCKMVFTLCVLVKAIVRNRVGKTSLKGA